MPVNNPSRYPLKPTHVQRRKIPYVQMILLVCAVGVSGTFLLPQIITMQVRKEQSQPVQQTYLGNSTVATAAFPVSVDPATKKIVPNPLADAIFANQHESLTASLGNVMDVINWIASLIDNTKLYQSLAAADGHLITISAGERKEEVTAELGYVLNWTPTEQIEFLTALSQNNPGLTDGMLAPGNYVVDNNMTPTNVAALMQLNFSKTILSHYSPATASKVPLVDALTVASLIEREAGGSSDQRIISGIIWNRLFKNMSLQLDATLQYAKGENTRGVWWQRVVPKDKYVASAFNTYAHPGLPPGPIANPSVASVLAALNPVPTDCLYYFHDSHSHFHCTTTYPEHVRLLKKYYGQGK